MTNKYLEKIAARVVRDATTTEKLKFAIPAITGAGVVGSGAGLLGAKAINHLQNKVHVNKAMAGGLGLVAGAGLMANSFRKAHKEE